MSVLLLVFAGRAFPRLSLLTDLLSGLGRYERSAITLSTKCLPS